MQLIFLGCRTWNVKAVSNDNIFQALVSGAFVHLAWLVSIAIGGISMHKIISNFRLEYIPIVLCSLTGSLIGTYIAMKKNIN